MKVMDYVRSKYVRFTAFLLCLICVGVITRDWLGLLGMDYVEAIWEDKTMMFDGQAGDFYGDIAELGKLYLYNLDENGEVKVSSALSEAAKTDLLEYLEREGILEQGEPALTSDKFDFFVSYGEHSYSNVDVGDNPETYFSDTERYPLMWAGNGNHLNKISSMEESNNATQLSSRNYVVSLSGGILYYSCIQNGVHRENFFGGKGINLYLCEKEDGTEVVLDETEKEQYLEEQFKKYLEEGMFLPASEEGKYYIDENFAEDVGYRYTGRTIDALVQEEQENSADDYEPAEEEDAIPTETDDTVREEQEEVRHAFLKENLKQYIAGILTGMDKMEVVFSEDEYTDEIDLDGYGSVYDGDKIAVYLAPKKAYLENMINIYNSEQSQGWDYLEQIIEAAVVLLLLLVYLIYATGYDGGAKKYVIALIDKIHMEFTVALFAVLVFVEAVTLSMTMDSFYFDYVDGMNHTSIEHIMISYSISVALIFAGVLVTFLSMVRRVRTGYKKSLLRGIFRWMVKSVKNCIKGTKTFYILRVNTMTKRQFVLLVLQGIVTVLAGFFGIIGLADSNGFIVLLVCGLWLLFFIWWFRCMTRQMKEIAGLGEQIDALYAGNYEPVSIAEDSIVADKADKLNHLSEGMKTAVERQVAAEKMKVELITNVSHDLKTPLTSIISYVDLLAKEELQPEAADYVRILEDKAARLSHIVSDVFDLAKASSGAEIVMARLDGSMLLKQVLADMEDQIKESGRIVKESIKTESYDIMGDGQKLYRVFQNLLDNALKYSMEGTRIFVTLEEEMGRMTVEVKNIASYEMDFSAEEILERFSRGDKARTTEGNGLGLSIAQSFTYVCGGSFDVQIDGDMFKVRVSFPAAPILE